MLDRVGVFELVLRARRRLGPRTLTGLCYHRILDPAEGDGLDLGVIDATPAQFDRQMALLTRHFTPVDTRDLARAIDGGPFPTNAAMVTFDDGYAECVKVALPILLRHGVKAVFFIPTYFVDQRRLFWWDRLSILVDRSRTRSWALEYPRPMTVELGDPAAARAALFRIVKSEPGLDLERFLADCGARSEIEAIDELEAALADRVVMTWDDVRALRDAGMDIQSHSHRHRVLQTMTEAEVLDDLTTSRRLLADEVGAEPTSIAYPVGAPLSDRPALLQTVRAAGFRFGFSNKTGINLMGRPLDLLNIRRLSLDTSFSPSLVRGLFAMPALAYR